MRTNRVGTTRRGASYPKYVQRARGGAEGRVASLASIPAITESSPASSGSSVVSSGAGAGSSGALQQPPIRARCGSRPLAQERPR